MSEQSNKELNDNIAGMIANFIHGVKLHNPDFKLSMDEIISAIAKEDLSLANEIKQWKNS